MSLVRFTGVEKGRTKNHLIFKGFIPSNNNFYEYEFDFIGTEIITTGYLSDDEKEQLVKKMQKDFGYAPYDLREAKKVLGKFKDYELDENEK